MKKIIIVLSFIFFGTFCNATEKKNLNLTENAFATIQILAFETNLNELNYTFDFQESCTIKQGQQVISNGEVVYEYIAVLHIDGMSCSEFFSRLMMMA